MSRKGSAVSPRGTLAGVAYAIGGYAVGSGGLLVMVLFLADLLGLAGVSDPPRHSPWTAAVADGALLLGWGVQHSVMARPAFKRWLARWVPVHLERATYCGCSGVALAMVCVLWSPLPGDLWVADNTVLRALLFGVGGAGWLVLLVATFEIDHAELFGLGQAIRAARGEPDPQPAFKTRWLYRVVRHPIQLGIFIGVWATPDFTVNRVVFAASMTLYMLVGLFFEERALVRQFGQTYLDYRARVPMLIPRLPWARR